VPEPEGSSPYLRNPANGPYPEPTESTPRHPAIVPKIHSDPIYASVFLVDSFPWALPPKPWSYTDTKLRLAILILI
jgi:hypothetical protein